MGGDQWACLYSSRVKMAKTLQDWMSALTPLLAGINRYEYVINNIL